MKRKATHYIYIIFFLLPFEGFFAQDITLKISSKEEIETAILEKIDYQKKHKDTLTLYVEIDRISYYLKNIGYLTNIIDSINKKTKDYTVYFSLNDKIENALIKVNSDSKLILKDLEIKNNTITVPIKKLKTTLLKISEILDNEGKSFSKVQLKNIVIKDKTLFADLKILQSKKRIINKVIIKGYENFPKSYLKNHFNIKASTIFNQKKIEQISESSKNLKFASEIKTPEILFTKDSTFLYMYLKKQQNNSFDGIVNFASKENGGVLFNGNIDLKLNDVLNSGEKFELFWNSIGDERQEFILSTETPYIFGSKFSPNLSFSIYKQDSTFLNTKFDSKLFYNINSKFKLALTYSSESSENLSKTINNNIETFNNYFVGFQFQYNIPKNDFFFNDKFNIKVNPTLGKRETNQILSNQFKIETSASYIWEINLRNSIFIKNSIGYLTSETFLNNELFRIGGVNSIRGYDEQSIFTNNFNYFNIEYRFSTSESSFLYTITDFGFIEENKKVKNVLGLGFGYALKKNNSLINIGIAAGNNTNNEILFKNSKLIINWVNFF